MISRTRLVRFAITLVAAALLASPFFSPASAQSEVQVLPVMSAERAAALVEAAERKLEYVPGEVLVKFKEGVSSGGQQRALMAVRSRPDARQLEWIGDVAVLRDASQPNARILAEQLSSQPEVAYAEPNYIRRLHATPNDPSYSRQWNFDAINMRSTWDITPGGTSDVIVAIVDTGVTSVPAQGMSVRTWDGRQIVTTTVGVAPSPDLASGRIVSPRDFTINPSAPSTFVVDTDGHGTHVASTAGEESNNSLALAGIAYNARIMPIKVCESYWDVQFAFSAAGIPGFVPPDVGGCPTSQVVAGIRFAADNGARIMNISLGGPSRSQAELDALNYAVSRGVFISISNGNEFEDGNAVQYPAAFAPDINGVMSVAAINRSRGHAFYSSTGPHTEISAPGGDSRDGGSAGEIWQMTIDQFDASDARIFPRFDRYAESDFQGTSMAAPHVAGVAALLWSRGVRTPATIEALLRQTAFDLGNAGKDDTFGYGLVQPRPALFGLGIRQVDAPGERSEPSAPSGVGPSPQLSKMTVASVELVSSADVADCASFGSGETEAAGPRPGAARAAARPGRLSRLRELRLRLDGRGGFVRRGARHICHVRLGRRRGSAADLEGTVRPHRRVVDERRGEPGRDRQWPGHPARHPHRDQPADARDRRRVAS